MEYLLALRGQRRHRITMEVRRDRLRSFVRRHVRRREIDPPQSAPLPRRLREREVPFVDGVESAAEEADIHKRL